MGTSCGATGGVDCSCEAALLASQNSMLRRSAISILGRSPRSMSIGSIVRRSNSFDCPVLSVLSGRLCQTLHTGALPEHQIACKRVKNAPPIQKGSQKKAPGSNCSITDWRWRFVPPLVADICVPIQHVHRNLRSWTCPPYRLPPGYPILILILITLLPSLPLLPPQPSTLTSG